MENRFESKRWRIVYASARDDESEGTEHIALHHQRHSDVYDVI